MTWAETIAKILPIAGAIMGVVSAVAVAVLYGFLYFNISSDITPQFQSIMGSVLVGSVVLSVLTYLALVQQSVATQTTITMILVFFPMVMACMALGFAA
jgi:ABC-type Na+ efflux pump permease subunit